MNWNNYIISIVLENKNLYFLYFFVIIVTYTIESIVIPRVTSNLTAVVNSDKGFSEVKKVLMQIVVLWTINQIFYSIDLYTRSYLIPKFEESVVNKVLTNVLLQYSNDYQEIDYTLVVHKMNHFPKLLRNISNVFFKSVLPRTLIIIVICGYFFKLNVKIGSVVLILVLIQLRHFKLSEKVCSPATHTYLETYDKLISSFSDKFQNLASIYGSGMLNVELENLFTKNKANTKSKVSAFKCTSHSQTKGYILNILTFAIISYMNFTLLKKGLITSKDFTTIFLISINLLNYLVDLSHTLPEFYYEMDVIKRYKDFFDTKNSDVVKPEFKLSTGTIAIKNLSFKYPKSDKPIFQNFTTTFENNNITGILGKSGRGKTTLLKIILGFQPIPDGYVFVDNQDINSFDLNSYRKYIGYINQTTKLFDTTVLNNISYGYTVDLNELSQVFDKYELNKVFVNLPNGLQTEVGLAGDKLSGGQRQIVLILRTFLNKSKKIIIMDEPTAAIDSDLRKVIYTLVRDFSINKTIIIITHDNEMHSLFNKKINL